jgi:hypothetical protein
MTEEQLAQAHAVLDAKRLTMVNRTVVRWLHDAEKLTTECLWAAQPWQIPAVERECCLLVLNLVSSTLPCIRQPRPRLVRQETATWGGCDLGNFGFWKQDYGWGVRVRRPFGARGRSSVRYGTRLGDLKENWFLLFSN